MLYVYKASSLIVVNCHCSYSMVLCTRIGASFDPCNVTAGVVTGVGVSAAVSQFRLRLFRLSSYISGHFQVLHVSGLFL